MNCGCFNVADFFFLLLPFILHVCPERVRIRLGRLYIPIYAVLLAMGERK